MTGISPTQVSKSFFLIGDPVPLSSLDGEKGRKRGKEEDHKQAVQRPVSPPTMKKPGASRMLPPKKNSGALGFLPPPIEGIS